MALRKKTLQRSRNVKHPLNVAIQLCSQLSALLVFGRRQPGTNWLALVRPADDLLPIRALYGETGNTNIGLNPLTSDKPIWYAGPDFAASVLLTGRVPEIIEAFRIIPRGMQNGMKKHLSARGN
jgi:hypothetical protein